MKIEIWSDVMCPFCYIGKYNFEQALEKLPFKNKVDVEWKSFQLDPTLDSSKAMSTSAYFKEKKGFPESQARQMMEHVAQAGKSVGIDFDFGKALITNTFTAHKLLHLAKKYKKDSEMEEALFKAHFVDGKNIADIDSLVSIAEDLGIDRQEALQALNSENLDYEVNQDIQEAKNNGINSVPFFVLNGKYAVSGAQPVDVFENALNQTYQEESPFENLASDGSSCNADGCSS
ncbi:DSBA oxidoreductase [Chryseobacterium sp. FH2]|uniref:DsbA family oxidoreductase n=1 Tax=Chryseobacterium sp. FH2 TaxID=1674291 RepID=UPI00065ADA0A|nr:DsbA family oxidoreductase [Chryseobacterium sp. FH2]KMQ69426.1 DSBA oxidoreductase [Chryseobacterium sp. FH2]